MRSSTAPPAPAPPRPACAARPARVSRERRKNVPCPGESTAPLGAPQKIAPRRHLPRFAAVRAPRAQRAKRSRSSGTSARYVAMSSTGAVAQRTTVAKRACFASSNARGPSQREGRLRTCSTHLNSRLRCTSAERRHELGPDHASRHDGNGRT